MNKRCLPEVVNAFHVWVGALNGFLPSSRFGKPQQPARSPEENITKFKNILKVSQMSLAFSFCPNDLNK